VPPRPARTSLLPGHTHSQNHAANEQLSCRIATVVDRHVFKNLGNARVLVAMPRLSKFPDRPNSRFSGLSRTSPSSIETARRGSAESVRAPRAPHVAHEPDLRLSAFVSFNSFMSATLEAGGRRDDGGPCDVRSRGVTCRRWTAVKGGLRPTFFVALAGCEWARGPTRSPTWSAGWRRT
jgi:hypothetical protein